jgi:hypothetical protein
MPHFHHNKMTFEQIVSKLWNVKPLIRFTNEGVIKGMHMTFFPK